MELSRRHIVKNIFSTIEISESSEVIWNNITNVKIDQFPDLLIFKVFDTLVSGYIKRNLTTDVRQRLVDLKYNIENI